MSKEKIKKYLGRHVDQSLDAIIAGINPRLSERRFKDYYVHVLFSRLQSTSNGAAELWIAEVAGKGRQAVDITDDNGDVIFTVPPIDSTLATNKPQAISLFEVIAQANNLKRARYDRQAEAVTQGGLSKFYQQQASNPDIAAWKYIFNRYGLLQSLKVKPATVDTATQDYIDGQFHEAADDF